MPFFTLLRRLDDTSRELDHTDQESALAQTRATELKAELDRVVESERALQTSLSECKAMAADRQAQYERLENSHVNLMRDLVCSSLSLLLVFWVFFQPCHLPA